MLSELLVQELALPAGGIAGALALVAVTMIKVRAVQKDNQANWTSTHMDRLVRERADAEERAKRLQEQSDNERDKRIQAEERVADLEEEVSRLRARLGMDPHTGAPS